MDAKQRSPTSSVLLPFFLTPSKGNAQLLPILKAGIKANVAAAGGSISDEDATAQAYQLIDAMAAQIGEGAAPNVAAACENAATQAAQKAAVTGAKQGAEKGAVAGAKQGASQGAVAGATLAAQQAAVTGAKQGAAAGAVSGATAQISRWMPGPWAAATICASASPVSRINLRWKAKN